jgi:predicted aspartyl protease
MPAVDGRHDGRRLTIPIRIYAPEPASDLTSVSGTALIDTGATASGITRNIANSLGLVGRGKRPLGSARGEVQAERYLFRIGLDGEQQESQPTYPFIFEDVIGFELTASLYFDALIGMDILRQCDLLVKRDGTFRLSFGRGAG